VTKLKSKISTKDEEFTNTADSLEKELVSLRDQLEIQQKDKDSTLKDKEALLEEVWVGFILIFCIINCYRANLLLLYFF